MFHRATQILLCSVIHRATQFLLCSADWSSRLDDVAGCTSIDWFWGESGGIAVDEDDVLFG